MTWHFWHMKSENGCIQNLWSLLWWIETSITPMDVSADVNSAPITARRNIPRPMSSQKRHSAIKSRKPLTWGEPRSCFRADSIRFLDWITIWIFCILSNRILIFTSTDFLRRKSHFIARNCGLSIEETLRSLMQAGLDTIPGGGAEILADDIRQRISPNKCTADTWLNVMEQAHQLGVKTTATMMFGHVETPEHIILHLMKIRDLQDRTRGFTAFIPWTFQPGNTKPSGRRRNSRPLSKGAGRLQAGAGQCPQYSGILGHPGGKNRSDVSCFWRQ